MNSRERVRTVLAHQLPDRIPNGLGGCETAGLHIVAYDNLQKVLDLPCQPPRLDTFMTNAVFEEPVIRAMDGDIILLASTNMCPSPLRGKNINQYWKEQKLWGKTFKVPVCEIFQEEPDGTLIWKNRGEAVCPKGTYFFDSPAPTDLLADFEIPDPDKFYPNDTFSDETLRSLEEAARMVYEETDLSLCLGESITDLQVSPAPGIGSMILMLEEPEIFHAFLQKCTDAALKQIRLLDQAVGKYVDILSIAHDFGDNRDVTIGPELWRSIYKPYYKQLFEGWRSITDMKINLHSCGAISNILGDLIECGVQIFNPVQTSAANMSIDSLKARFGKDLIFWGGAYDGQLISEQASYDQVYHAVYDNVKKLGVGGNFIFSGVHNLPATTPEAHLKAMIDAYKDARDY